MYICYQQNIILQKSKNGRLKSINDMPINIKVIANIYN